VSAGSDQPRVLVETSHALPLVTVTVGSRLGSTLDPAGKEGVCRLTARLVRRTAGGQSPEVIDERIDALGGALGVDTGVSTVTLGGTVIARSLEPFAELVLGALGDPGLATEELDRLVRETRAELVEARDHDKSLADRWFRRRLYEGHPYARPTSGTDHSLRSVERRDVVAARDRHFARENLVFAFSGAIDRDRAERLAERLAGAAPPGPPPPDPTPEPEPVPGRRLLVVDKPERTQTQILIGCLGTLPADPDHLALHVGSTIFGGTFTARLMHEVRVKRGWSYGAYAQLPYDRRRRAFSLWTFPKASDAAACVALQIDMLEKLVAGGVTEKELAWAKRYLVRSNAFSVDTAQKRVHQALDEAMFDLPPGYHSEYTERVCAVTLDEVNAALRLRLEPRNLLVTVVGTAGDLRADLERAIPGLSGVEVVPFDRDA